MDAVDAVIGKACLAAEHHHIAGFQHNALLGVAALPAADVEHRIVAQRDRHDRRREVRLVLIAVRAHAWRRCE